MIPVNRNSKGFAHFLLLLLVVIFAFGGIGYYAYKNGQIKLPSQKSLKTLTPTPLESQFCGGIAGISCPEGYTCKLDGNYPDAGGKCFKD